MKLYFITYSTSIGTFNQDNCIKYKEIEVRETAKSYIFDQTRIPKNKIDVIKSFGGNSPSISVSVYSTSLDIMETFKQQVINTLQYTNETLKKQLELSQQNINHFNSIYGTINQTQYHETTKWHNPKFWDCEDDIVEEK